jgi:zinc transport system substrate-binding protein
MVSLIADTMSTFDPANAAIYEKNAEAYNTTLDSADAEARKAFEGKTDKKFLTFHPAYGYFADEYGLTMLSLEEEGKESTPQRLQEMVDLAKAEGITTVFTNAETDSRQSAAFADEIGGKAVVLAPLAEDYAANIVSMAKAIAEAMK